MAKAQSPAFWAIKRVLDLCGLNPQERHAREAANDSPIIKAFARYIEDHEAPPPDPLLDEAREVIARCQEAMGMTNAAKAARLGKCDTQMSMRITLAALRRGIELGRQGIRS